jgi:hypothetical protein
MSLISWALHFGRSELLTGGGQQTGWDRVPHGSHRIRDFGFHLLKIHHATHQDGHQRRPPPWLPTRASCGSDDPRAMRGCTSDGCWGFVKLWKCPFPRRRPLKIGSIAMRYQFACPRPAHFANLLLRHSVGMPVNCQQVISFSARFGEPLLENSSNDFKFSSRQYCPGRTSQRYCPSSTNRSSRSCSFVCSQAKISSR